ncbi:xanthine dehydrogenase accessory protein XdhC [Massilia sp. TS11]|uniref:xanthine dehydrogenase accessory protein XdhC n=1 Tax=Massilia sp. TS11 TaxID=2908003 RepID=UPI001EDC11D1|nr:xanthine dehydrogenase accessory protein XdhC [Massilia sp. TS11]MCG2586099.1 xanthine dehydrogenase accessory protein XdhC [Massilia sp. TS11]
MEAWLSAPLQGAAVLVTVARVEGSGPREPGACMRVSAAAVVDTIGGGHLELQAIATARTMLADGRERHLERYALGPSLGQCCGGVVHLVFERIEADLLATIRPGDWRLLALDGACERRTMADAPPFDPARGSHLLQEQDGRRWFAQLVPAVPNTLLLFGAGHVGAALVRALAPLPCRVLWVDEREELFPSTLPANVQVEATDTPEAVVAAAPDGADFLVMTHSHALDQRLAEAILLRSASGWFGLIGSHTKRKQFEHRLLARGVDPARLAAMACPIGLPGITGKQPAVIAAAVAAQLLQLWEARQTQRNTGAAPIRLVASRQT